MLTGQWWNTQELGDSVSRQNVPDPCLMIGTLSLGQVITRHSAKPLVGPKETKP